MEKSGLQTTASIMLIMLVSLVLLYYGQDFLIPLVLGLMAWSVLDALADHIRSIRFGSRRMPRWLAMLVSVLALSLVLLLIYQILVGQAPAIEAAAPVYQENFIRMINDLAGQYGVEELPTSDTLMANVDFSLLLGWLGSSVKYLVSTLVLVLMYTGFLFAEQRVMMKKIHALAGDPDKAERMSRSIGEISSRLQNYIWIKTVVSTATGGRS